jgi:hypothetical protein
MAADQDFQQKPLTMFVEVIQDENATAVKLIDYNGRYTTGSSKRCPGDPKDYRRGLDLAIARAMIKHGEAILKREDAK